MIELDVKYTYERYKKFYWFTLFRGKNYKRGIKIFPIVTALMIFYVILFTVWMDNVLLRVIFSVLSIICILFYVAAFFMPRYYVKRSPALFETNINLIFGDESFITTQTGDAIKGTGETKFSALWKVYETTDSFYLYHTPAQALLLSKDDFVTGTPAELRELLQKNLEVKKYIVCK